MKPTETDLAELDDMSIAEVSGGSILPSPPPGLWRLRESPRRKLKLIR
ncbi:MAG: hypothetical protein ACK5JR_16020 [Tropicimonas sp.]